MGLETVQAEVLDKVETKSEASSSTASVVSLIPTKIEQYSIEYSKSSRSKCKKCDENIDTDAIRMGVKRTKSSWDGFYHLNCFSEIKTELEFNFKPEE
jgi:hypothetical protein